MPEIHTVWTVAPLQFSLSEQQKRLATLPTVRAEVQAWPEPSRITTFAEYGPQLVKYCVF